MEANPYELEVDLLPFSVTHRNMKCIGTIEAWDHQSITVSTYSSYVHPDTS